MIIIPDGHESPIDAGHRNEQASGTRQALAPAKPTPAVLPRANTLATARTPRPSATICRVRMCHLLAAIVMMDGLQTVQMNAVIATQRSYAA